MRKIISMALLALLVPTALSSQVSYQHPSKRSFLQYEVDSNGHVAFQLNYFVNSASDDYFFAFPGQTVDLQGPLNIPLAYTPSLNEVFYPDSCREYIIKMVFRSSFQDLSSFLNGPNYLEFNFNAQSLQKSSPDNLQSNQVPMASRLRLYPYQDTSSLSWKIRSCGTLSTEHYPLVNFPRAGVPQSLALGAQQLGANVDSLEVISIPIISGPNYISGYNQSTPFPDITESGANGPNSFSSKHQYWRFEVNDTNGMNLPFVSIYGLRYSYYSDGNLYATVDHHGWTSIEAPASGTAALVSIGQNGNFQAVSSAFHMDTMLVFINDTFQIDLNAISVSDTSEWEIIQNPISPGMKGSLGSQWQGATLTSLNANGSFRNSGLNQVRFEWIPSLTNFTNGPRNIKILIRNVSGTCPNVKERYVELLLRLRFAPQILGPGGISSPPDTVTLCGTDLVSSLYYPRFNTDTSSYYWSPGNWFSGTDSLLQFVSSISPSQSGYLYLHEWYSAKKIDSVYINYIAQRNSYLSYQRFPDYLRLNDSLSQAYRMALVNNYLFYGGQQDSFPIIGAGLYSLISLPGGSCYWVTDTIRVDNELYGSSLPIDTLYFPSRWNYLGTDSYRLSFRDVNNRGYLKELNLVDALNSKAQYLHYSVYEDNIEILKDSVFLDTSSFTQRIGLPIGINLDPVAVYQLELSSGYSLRLNFAKNINYPLNTGQYKPLQMLDFEKSSNNATWYRHTEVPYIGFVFGVPPVGLEEENSKFWTFYPNPAKDKLYIQGTKVEGELQLRDLQGRLLLSTYLSSETEWLSLDDFKAGTYILSYQGRSRKLIILD